MKTLSNELAKKINELAKKDFDEFNKRKRLNKLEQERLERIKKYNQSINKLS